jgi:hypothetical protein
MHEENHSALSPFPLTPFSLASLKFKRSTSTVNLLCLLRWCGTLLERVALETAEDMKGYY